MSEEILEKQSEELEEEQQAVAESSGKKIKEDDAPEEEESGDEEEVEEAKKVSEEDEGEEEEVEESVSVPKTKAGMMKAIYDQLNSMKKAELSDSFSKILGATIAEEGEEEWLEDPKKRGEGEGKVKKLSKEDLEINVKEDIDAMISGEELSEEFKTKASTIFEAAVSAKVIAEVNERIGVFEENYKTELKEAVDTHKKETTEKVDGYLNYVVEEWVKENELAVEKGIRSELVEDFMTGLKNLFTEHYIDIPEEKVDLVDDLFEKVEDLEKKLDESVEDSVEIRKQLAEYKKEETLRNVSEDLADTEREKLKTLSDGVDFEDADQYKEKLEVIKENYFPTATEKQTQPITEEVETPETEEVEKSDPSMERYVNALKRHN